MPILVGLAIAAAGLVPWSSVAALNASHRPDIPWAALAMTAYLVALVAFRAARASAAPVATRDPGR
jgi:hypothetical protein